jgi:hypothetical protein
MNDLHPQLAEIINSMVLPKSQRDFALQPKVASREQPWDHRQTRPNPNGVVPAWSDDTVSYSYSARRRASVSLAHAHASTLEGCLPFEVAFDEAAGGCFILKSSAVCSNLKYGIREHQSANETPSCTMSFLTSAKRVQELETEVAKLHAQLMRIRLTRPDWKAMAQEFGRISPHLRALYEDDEIIRHSVTRRHPSGREELDISIFGYYPADGETLAERWPAMQKFFLFGGDGAGGGYYVDPRLDDPEIHYWEHEDDHTVASGVRLSEYLSLPRVEHDDEANRY